MSGVADNRQRCKECNNEFSDETPLCPHCGRPSLYVNVIRAEDANERTHLQARYDRAVNDACSKGCESVLRDFERAMTTTKSVLARKGFVVESLVSSDARVFATFYQECLADIRLPEGSEWDELRETADIKLFGRGKDRIQFAALTLDGEVPSGYGDHFLILREDMIAHRASVFETNSALFPDRYVGVMPSTGLPPGFRATWQERHILCMAKLASQLNSGTQRQEYGKILLTANKNPQIQEFVEVHVWGPMTILTVECVKVRRHTLGRTGTGARRKKFERDLERHGVTLSVI